MILTSDSEMPLALCFTRALLVCGGASGLAERTDLTASRNIQTDDHTDVLVINNDLCRVQ